MSRNARDLQETLPEPLLWTAVGVSMLLLLAKLWLLVAPLVGLGG